MSALAGLDPRDAAAALAAEHDEAWLTELSDALDGRRSGGRLERVMRLWQLSRTELGSLFGVSRQAVSKWLHDGVPADRAMQLADVQAITDLLDQYLTRDRIPAVVRRPAPKLGSMSLLELVADGRSREALALTRQMFAFTDVHA